MYSLGEYDDTIVDTEASSCSNWQSTQRLPTGQPAEDKRL